MKMRRGGCRWQTVGSVTYGCSRLQPRCRLVLRIPQQGLSKVGPVERPLRPRYALADGGRLRNGVLPRQVSVVAEELARAGLREGRSVVLTSGGNGRVLSTRRTSSIVAPPHDSGRIATSTSAGTWGYGWSRWVTPRARTRRGHAAHDPRRGRPARRPLGRR